MIITRVTLYHFECFFPEKPLTSQNGLQNRNHQNKQTSYSEQVTKLTKCYYEAVRFLFTLRIPPRSKKRGGGHAREEFFEGA